MKKDPLQPDHCATLLSALAAPERLQIIRLLRGGPHNVGKIADAVGIPAVNLSHHLTVLRHAGLVRSQKHGRFVNYSLIPGVLQADDASGATEHLNLGCCRLEIPSPGKGPRGES